MEKADFFQEQRMSGEEFRKLYDRYYRPGIAFLVSIIKNREDAENMLQDVFLKIWLRKDRLAFDARLQGYIFASLRNIAFDFLKKLEREEQMKRIFMEQMTEEESVTDEPGFAPLTRAVEKLSEKRKMILRMNIEEGKSYQEIAEIMRISKNTVKNQLIKAKQHLKNTLEYPLAVQ
ncbi:MAG: sigma-70 family RNA polymerase sigma factor [Leadbetterella sp.]|nr:sigma-70 family RNA polymerase sigma factor [Leadbetterella sp.]